MSALRAARCPSAFLVFVVLGSLLLSGCLRAETNVEVDGDGSGTVALEVQFDEVSLSEAGLSQDNLVKLVETATQSIDGVEVSAASAAGSKGFRVSIPFDDYRQLTQALTTGQYGGMSTRIFQTFEINEGADGNWSMKATVDPIGLKATLAQVPAGITGSATLVDSSTDVVFSMSLPGKVLRSNADQIDGGEARWNLKGDIGAATFSQENEPAGLTELQWVMIGAGALLFVGFLLVFLTAAGGRRGGRRRRGKKRKVDTDHSSSWAQTGPAPTVLAPSEWTSAPPYSSHGWGEATPNTGEPSSPEVGSVPAAPSVGTPSLAGGPGDGAPPVKPVPVPAGPAPAVVSGRAGPPVLPAGFVPTPDNSFPLTHSYSQPVAPVTPQPYAPTAAPEPVAVPTGAVQNRTGPPALPEGFVPNVSESFPNTHSAGPPPTDVPPPFSGDAPEPAGEPVAYRVHLSQPGAVSSADAPPPFDPSVPPPFTGDVPSPPSEVADQPPPYQG